MKLLKRFTLFSMVFSLAVISFASGLFSKHVFAATYENSLVLHYNRDKGNPTDYAVWVWVDGGEGAEYAFSDSDDFGGIATVPLKKLTMDKKIGVIVKKPGVWTKDEVSGSDRFLKIADGEADSNGNYHFYLLNTDADIFTSSESALNPSKKKIRSAVFFDFNSSSATISFKTNVQSGVTASSIVFTKNGTALAISDFSFAAGVGKFKIAETVDFSAEYVLQVTFDAENVIKKAIGFESIYDAAAFEEMYTYTGNDLGAVYSKSSTTFKLWAPISNKVEVLLYETGHPKKVSSQVTREDGTDTPFKTVEMTKKDKGVWEATVSGDLNGVYYTYNVTNGNQTNEITDPYTRTTGVNVPSGGWTTRGMVIDLESCNSSTWNKTSRPSFSGRYTDAIIYELHVRDLTSSSTWTGTDANRGKLLGLVESGTLYEQNGFSVTTGFDHIKELGVTHVQLLPLHQNGILDGSRVNDRTYLNATVDGIFNWGYMTNLYNVVEGTYSSDPYNGFARVREFKTVIEEFHKAGIRINMDVVYNHTAYGAGQNFEKILPGYYHRLNADGSFSNGSGCGNETASERPMFRKFMIDSTSYWVSEYKVDGFRFDLMGIHDYETMNAIKDALNKIDDTIMVYGEPWTGGTVAIDSSLQATNGNMNKMPGVAAFNDVIRNAIRGVVYGDDKGTNLGWMQGNSKDFYQNMLYGIVGGNKNAFSEIKEGSSFTFTSASQSINYVECHDNLNLYDKIIKTGLTGSAAYAQQTQANSVVMTSMGCVFIQAGAEFARSKKGNENSYNASDKVNQIDWSKKINNQGMIKTYQSLIEIRKEHPSFRMSDYQEIGENISFITTGSQDCIAYQIKNSNDSWGDIVVIHANANYSSSSIAFMPEGTYQVMYSSKFTSPSYQEKDVFDGKIAKNETLILVNTNSITVPGKKGCGSSTALANPLSIAGIVAMTVGVSGFLFFVLPKKDKKDEVM